MNMFHMWGINFDEEIRVKITSTLKELKPENNNFNYEKNDVVHIKSFGTEDTSINSSEWLNNTKSHYDVLSVEISDELEDKYSINTYDNHHLNPGYKIILSDNFSNSVNGVITRVTSKNSFIVKADNELNVDNTWKIENQILKKQHLQNIIFLRNTLEMYKTHILTLMEKLLLIKFTSSL